MILNKKLEKIKKYFVEEKNENILKMNFKSSISYANYNTLQCLNKYEKFIIAFMLSRLILLQIIFLNFIP